MTIQRLSMSQCPACHAVNPDTSRFCGACGTPLVMRCPHCQTINARTREQCHHCHRPLREVADPETVTLVLLSPEEAPPPADWRLELRDEPAAAPAACASPARAWPELVADLDAPTAPAPEPVLEPTPLPTLEVLPEAPPAAPPINLTERRARRRAAVRRSQLRRKGARVAEPLRDVLVLEPDLDSRLQLCRVLVAFGFKPHVAVTVAEAQGLSLSRPHAAAILGLAGEDEGAAELCRQLRDAPRGRPAALIAVVDRSHHADRVRMQLAGADQVIFRPAGRGDIARALDDCGISLPHDPRQGTPPA